jgi:hypothetical protein
MITRNDLDRLGFEPSRSYEHDHYITTEFTKGRLTVEKTYDKDDNWIEVSCMVVIGEEYADIDTVEQLKAISEIFNR